MLGRLKQHQFLFKELAKRGFKKKCRRAILYNGRQVELTDDVFGCCDMYEAFLKGGAK